MQDAVDQTDDVILERKGSVAIIRLNRPRALNSVTLPMVHMMKQHLEHLVADPLVSSVILTGEGDRGLCAGGDVRVIHDLGKAGDPDVTRFWREEFPLNYLISHYSKPYVALMDGIVMGGGVGLAAHGRFRVVTERTRLAMPETGIGYFPDVGATWLLPKAPGEVGSWLGLTGSEIGAADAIYAGLADIHVPSTGLPELIDALAGLPPGSGNADVAAVLATFASTPGEGMLETNRTLIDNTFRFDRVEEIAAALGAHGQDFAIKTLETLTKRSPTSLMLALRLLRLGRGSSGLVECLEREFLAGTEILRQHDFYEGVRAAIIDKDRNPKWRPAALADVRDEDIDRYFVGKHGVLFADHRL
jgi:enoyl-CoA hydratase